MSAYSKAIEKLDTKGMDTLFTQDAQVIESGSVEGTFLHYLEHHLAPELIEFSSFTFSDYNISITVDLPYAFVTETYQYTIIVKEGNKEVKRKGVATSVLKKENGKWKIINTHTSSRR